MSAACSRGVSTALLGKKRLNTGRRRWRVATALRLFRATTDRMVAIINVPFPRNALGASCYVIPHVQEACQEEKKSGCGRGLDAKK
jgi:hypothetical protein